MDFFLWNLNNFKTSNATIMEVTLKVKDGTTINNHKYLGQAEKTEVNYKLPNQVNPMTVNTTKTPVLRLGYDVTYETNIPHDCSNTLIAPTKGTYLAFDTVTKSLENLSCDNYLFKGWEVTDDTGEDIKFITDDSFFMPEHDVTIRAIWSNLSIAKTQEGTINEKLTLWTIAKKDAENHKYGGNTYTGEDAIDYAKTIYYYNDKTNNNVKFGGFCWQMVRTTETGGVKLVYNGKIRDDDSCNNLGKEQQIAETSIFNNITDMPAGLGYMYNSSSLENYKINSYVISNTISFNINRYVAGSSNIYLSKYTPSYSDGVYKLTNSTRFGRWDENYDKAKGYYTCFSESSTSAGTTCNKVYYIVATEKNAAIVLEMSAGQTLNEVNSSLVLGAGFSGEGPYTLTGTKTIKKSDLANDYNNYIGYYICADSTCNSLDKISFATSYNYETSKIYSYKYGQSFTYKNGKYTLNNSKMIQDVYTDLTQLNSYHYTCLTNKDEREKLAYVYISHVVDNRTTYLRYVELSNGKSEKDMLEEMLWNDEVNKENSEIKKVVDKWYENNFTDYTKYIENEIYCNDRSINQLNGWDPNGGDLSEKLMFTPVSMKYNFVCERKNDQFTVNDGSGKGNGKLTYPVGLLTYSEAYWMGDFANTTNEYWLLSPYYFDFRNIGTSVKRNGYIHGGATLNATKGVRPVITIKDILVIDGDGTVTKLYELDIEEITE